MIRNNEEEAGKDVRIIAVIFCIVLAVLFSFGAYITFPVRGMTPITSLRVDELQNRARTTHDVYTLRAEEYRVLGAVDSEVIVDRFTWKKHRLVFYEILVASGAGDPYRMIVRVQEQAQDLAQGQTVTLQGMLSETDREQRPDSIGQALQDAGTVQNSGLCLNTDIDSRAVQILKTIVFILLDIACICLLIRILKRG